jgi:molybdate transport system substrate-binding protein
MDGMNGPMWCRGFIRWTAALLLTLAAAGVQAENVTVFAAASLKDALDGVAAQYEKAKGDKLVISYAASSALAKQIEAGAPAELFISADTDWMDYLAQRKLIDPASRVDLLRNRIALVAPADSAVKADIVKGFPLAKLLGDGRLAMADPDSVPAGKYGKAALEALGVWASVEPKVARGENVRAALLFVSRGEAPLGIVYMTDAAADKKVRVVGVFPENTHPPIIYPVALIAGRKGNAPAAFLDYLKSPAARATFEKYGFGR